MFPSPDLDKALLDLRKRGLLQYAGESQRYDLHPIVRHYAYDRLPTLKKQVIHENLREYFDALNLTRPNLDFIVSAPVDLYLKLLEKSPKEPSSLDDLGPTIELYYHTVRAGLFTSAIEILKDELLPEPLYFRFGAYHLCIELLSMLFSKNDDEFLSMEYDQYDQSWALNFLGNSYSLSGHPHDAIQFLEKAASILQKLDKTIDQSAALASVGHDQARIGSLHFADINLQQSLSLNNKRSSLVEAVIHQELGFLFTIQGMWKKTNNEFESAIRVTHDNQNKGITYAYQALQSLLLARSNPSSLNHVTSAIKFAKHALDLVEETARDRHAFILDYVRAHWLLGAAYCANNELTLAEENLSKALNLCRQINVVDYEADILLDLARLRYAQGDFKDAQEKASEALVITERSGYVLQGADVNLFLAELALTLPSPEGRGKAREYAETALKLATCDGPPYYYKVAYEEAERMLEKLK